MWADFYAGTYSVFGEWTCIALLYGGLIIANFAIVIVQIFSPDLPEC